MIAADQPTIFGGAVIAALSSLTDGNMKFGEADNAAVAKNRQAFLQHAGIHPSNTTLVGITYATDDFTKYRTVQGDDKSKGMLAPETGPDPVDALVVDTSGHALFLPIADCVGAILYDSAQKVLMVSHLGRHSVEVNGASKSVAYLVDHFSSNPTDIKVWLSPAVGKESYPLHAFDGQSLHEVILGQLLASGVVREHIEISTVDTAKSDNYYSHSEFLKGNESQSGRFAIVAMMPVQGEPAF